MALPKKDLKLYSIGLRLTATQRAGLDKLASDQTDIPTWIRSLIDKGLEQELRKRQPSAS